MLMKFHINSNGEAGRCSATKGGCPFGGESEHFTSAEAAREHYEKTMTGEAVPAKATKKPGRVKPVLPENETFENRQPYPYETESKKAWKAYNEAAAEARKDPSLKPEADKLYQAAQNLSSVYRKAYDLHKERVSAVLASGYTGPMHEALTNGQAIVGTASSRTKMQGFEGGVGAITGLSVKSQEAFYGLPASYAVTLRSTHKEKGHALPAIDKLVNIGAEVYKNNPNFVPRDLHVVPRVAEEWNRNREIPIPQMQNVAGETYSLLQEYTKQKYGANVGDFWRGVKSDTANYPKISDFVRREKEFDQQLAN
jgi:hypothetical protein